MNMLPLSNLRVIDLSQLLPGPFCTWVLAEYGADIVKIEPLGGESAHRLHPLGHDTSLFNLGLNRGKRSIVLNLKRPSGKEIFLKLARKADVLVEGFRPGVMDRLRMGWKHLHKVNPQLIYCAISGYGQDGPRRDRVGHDLNYLALSGILGLQSELRGPCVLPVQLADIGAGGLPAALGILLAIVRRQQTGKGSLVDVSMLDALVSWLAPYAGLSGKPWVRNALLRGELACYNLYRTKDRRYLAVGCVEAKFWSALCFALRHQDWIPLQFEPGRAQRDLRRQLQTIIQRRSAEAWERFFAVHETCVDRVLLPEEMEKDPQVKARGIVYEQQHPNEGRLRQVRPPIRITGCEPSSFPAPHCGEHTDKILSSLGYSRTDIQHFRAEGIVG
jgi:crotonobetainyl-CoA:carnitine CoA-transferase CaiB-like acyl-CoA transferase